ncbi:MAG: hypothetical protein WCV85_00600 [Patescibacteria group bacterium]
MRKPRRVNERKAAVATLPVPKPGDTIYVPTQLYLSHGRDDIQGGRATVTKVEPGISGGKKVHYVSVKKIPNSFNWEHYLAEKQTALKKEFGRKRAKPDPDYHPDVNE